MGKCQSKSIKNFLRKEGYLSSVHVTEGESITLGLYGLVPFGLCKYWIWLLKLFLGT